MNERLKELYVKAVTCVRTIYLNREVEPEGDFDEWLAEAVAEKFAELIVRECAMLVDSKTEYSYGVADSWCQGKDVLEHFGIEE